MIQGFPRFDAKAKRRFGTLSVVPILGVVMALLLAVMSEPPTVQMLSTNIYPPWEGCVLPIVETKTVVLRGEADGAFTIDDSRSEQRVLRTGLASALRDWLIHQAGKNPGHVYIDFADHMRFADAASALDTISGLLRSRPDVDHSIMIREADRL